MPYDPMRHDRRSIRLQRYDYTQSGAYFITIVVARRKHMFGEVIDGSVCLNEIGEIVLEEWFKTSEIRPYTRLKPDEFVVMPNHIHGIIHIIDPPVRATRRFAPTKNAHGSQPRSIGAIIAQHKSIVTKRVHQNVPDFKNRPIWQRNYWEHVIRNERALDAIRRYIRENPRCWNLDRYNIAPT